MKSGLMIVCLLLAAAASGAPAPAQSLPADLLAAHWYPPTAERARNRTLAAAVWLERGAAPVDWPGVADAAVARLQPSIERIGPVRVSLVDGLMAWLVASRAADPSLADVDFPEPGLAAIDRHLARDHAAGELARLRAAAAYEAAAIWTRVAAELGAGAAEALGEFWAPLLAELGDDEAAADVLGHARLQGARMRELAAAGSASERLGIRDAMLRHEADQAWRTGRVLDVAWLAFEALARLSRADAAAAGLAADWQVWLDAIRAEAAGELRLVDLDLPVVIALLEDAAGSLAAPDQGRSAAAAALADSYARLVLFAPDMTFYLDQPVREPVRRAIAACRADAWLVGPLPRGFHGRCVARLESLIASGLGSEELVGGARGPFAPQFLRRELGLVSWQRAAYIEGHLAWLLEADCQSSSWINVLDWSLLVEHLMQQRRQRPGLFPGADWADLVNRLAGQMRELAAAHEEWLDCLTGRGSRRRDPVVRLLAHHRAALGSVSRLLAEARAVFYQAVTRPGADIDLDGPVDQITGYRPQGLAVGPCPQAQSCGARVELPVNRALLDLFPNAFLLADQLGIGELGLCYDRVRWVDRTREPARRPALKVADYYGRLSFDLVATLTGAQHRRTVFRYRLTDSQRRHYLFAADDEAVLASDCPLDQVGRAISSQLDPDHPGLVPNRLTYFANAPTTPEAELVANWDRGAQWRDWFVSGQGVRTIEKADPGAMETVLGAALAELGEQRERQLIAPLINPPRSGDQDPLVVAMSEVADTAALLRRVLELHYPRIIRQYAPIRALLVGEAGLMTRDRVRWLRARGVAASRMPELGAERAEHLGRVWLDLPASLRERGQRAPEIDYSLERLFELERPTAP